MMVIDDQSQDVEENIGNIKPPNISSATGSFITCSTVNAKYNTSRVSMFLPSSKCSKFLTAGPICKNNEENSTTKPPIPKKIIPRITRKV